MAAHEPQSRSPLAQFSSAFSAFSKSPLSPSGPSDNSPKSFSTRRSSSTARHGNVLGAASIASAAERQQEESYFTDLLSYSLERLAKEPELLQADQDQLRRQSQECAVQHYRAFIDVASCLRTLREEVAGIDQHLDSLQEDLPALNSACDSFTRGASEANAKRAQNKQLLKHHGVLLEVLDVPWLMNTCLRNGNYDDALDLRAFVTKTALLHPDLQLVQKLVQEVETISETMLAGLLDRLRSSIQLPECLRVVGYLRRLAPFPEAKLRQMFLQCREEWLAELVADLDTSNAYDYLKRLTDAHRVQVLDVVMQFRAIFADESSAQEAAEAMDGGTIYSWAEHRVVFYLEELAKQLPRIREGGGLASVLEHCMYCGMSLGRQGLDFRGLLPPIFEACVLQLFTSSVQAAVETSLMVLDMHKWVALPSLASRRSKALPQAGEDDKASPAKEGVPPYALMEQPPLAMLTNGLLSALNELRHCAPLSLQPRLAAVLQDALEAVVRATAHYKATRALGEGEAPLLDALCTALTESVCPYIAACFTRVYPSATPAINLAKVTAPLLEQQSEVGESGGAADVEQAVDVEQEAEVKPEL